MLHNARQSPAWIVLQARKCMLASWSLGHAHAGFQPLRSLPTWGRQMGVMVKGTRLCYTQVYGLSPAKWRSAHCSRRQQNSRTWQWHASQSGEMVGERAPAVKGARKCQTWSQAAHTQYHSFLHAPHCYPLKECSAPYSQPGPPILTSPTAQKVKVVITS